LICHSWDCLYYRSHRLSNGVNMLDLRLTNNNSIYALLNYLTTRAAILNYIKLTIRLTHRYLRLHYHISLFPYPDVIIIVSGAWVLPFNISQVSYCLWKWRLLDLVHHFLEGNTSFILTWPGAFSAQKFLLVFMLIDLDQISGFFVEGLSPF